MNKLEKFFNTLHNSQSRVLKKYTTQELVGQIKEYVDYTPYICKNIYRLLISQSSEDRVNGASILKSIMFQFRLATDFKIEYTDNKDEYFSCTGEEFVAEPKRSVKEQTRLVKAMADLEHVDVKIVNEIDFKAHTEFKIKKQKVKDKEIENIFDFFENLTANLLNYEWNKRHGAFLAYTAMFSQAWNGDREIKVDSTLFMKIYEILKNDKFNDFVEDKTTAPVREAAAELLACIYPRIPVREETILDELYRFLQDADWQTQYSGLVALRSLRKYIKKKRELCSLLESLLVDSDEDVKFLSADLLSSLVEYCDRERVGEKCWENIKDEEEIAVSKTSIIQLLSLTGYKIEENIEYLFPCFSSPVVEVRKSVLEMVRGIENESIDFLVAESILLDEKEEVRELAVGVLRGKSLSKNFLNHFMRILSQSLYEPYSHNDFVSYDELMFTKSGVKLIGEDTILKNRIRLFEVMKDSSGSSSMKEDTAIGMVFNILYKLFSKDSKEGTTKRFKEVEDLEVEDLEVENLYKKCKDLRLLPLKELRNIISSTTNNIASSTTIHPMGDPIYRDYLRLRTLLEFPKVGIEIFKKETCVDFLRIYSNLLFEHKRELEIDLFIEEAYSKLVEGDEYDNLRIFFRVFGYEAISRMRFTATSGIPSSRLVFFGKTLEIYRENFGELGSLFEEAYKARYFPVLKEFVKDLKYGEEFVNKILEDEDLDLLSGVIEELDHSFYPLFIKPLLRRMSSSTSSKLDIGTTGTTTIGTSGTTGTTTLGTSGTTTIGTTTLATSGTFSYIVPRLTFEINRNISKDFSKKILKAKESLEALLDISKVPEYTCRCPTSLVLRGYQVEGVKWISFLFSFNLNGILADDMGLGKTIQVLYFVCSEIYQTNKQVLVLCPSSLTGHWVSEVQRHFPQVSVSLYKKKSTTATSITVVSYDMFRNDYQNFTTREWFYVVLDEGHVLRNPNTLLYSRICLLRSPHKLILTGTPVHNSLDDLVSIFHFIMPNYLSKDDIHKTTTKTTTTKTTTKNDQDVEKMYKKLEEINKKILPFILRRLKIDVLTDLPPKIIRDVTVEMGPIQQEIYSNIDCDVEDLSYSTAAKGLKRTRDLLHAASHSAYFRPNSGETPCKVKALEDIINLCGGEDIRNKILIFFQYKSSIDFVLKDLKNINLKYLRLDGSVPSSKRSKIAQDFNEGPVPLLFLTTQVGGLGLNLTGADTVVFYEHDWNPFNDLQAMDRAHRIGQKKTVNVFRLITKGTLEEKVMDLQSFKMFIASSLVSQQNADIETMDTKDLLERFQ